MFTVQSDYGNLDIYGEWPSDNIVVILNRNNVVKDDPLIKRVIRFFTEAGLTVIDHQSEWMLLEKEVSNFKKASKILAFPPRLIKLAIIAIKPKYRKFLSKQYRNHSSSIEHRSEVFQKLIQYLGPKKQISVFSRSAGGLIASTKMDELNIKNLVCLGYPFQVPNKPAEPERYSHLSDIKTPFLIIQGTRDRYGGTEIKRNYNLSDAIKIHFIDTDHDFEIPECEWNALFSLIYNFIMASSDADAC